MQTNDFQTIWEDELQGPETGTLETTKKRIEILLDKDPKGEGFGFVLRGGAYCDPTRSLPLTVTKIIPGSPADSEGTLQVGDRILEINGADMSHFTVQQAANILNEAERDVILLVEYDVAVLDWVSSAAGPILVEIEKPAGKGLDITLSSVAWNGIDVICIDSVYEAGIADRSGCLHAGDYVIRIDGIPLEGKSVKESSAILQSNTTDRIQLEVLPVVAQVKRGVGDPVDYTTNVAPDSSSLPSYNSAVMLGGETSLINAGLILSEDLGDPSNRHLFHQHRPPLSNQGFSFPPPSYGTRSLSTLRGFTPPLKQSTHRSVTPPNNFKLRNFPAPHNGPLHFPFGCSTPPNSVFSAPRGDTPPPLTLKTKKVISNSFAALPSGYGATVPVGGVVKTPANVKRVSRASLNHVDVTEVVLFGGQEGFGVKVDVMSNEGAPGESAVVTHLQTNGEADRSGVIQEGDRVIAVNGKSVKGKSSEEVSQLISSCVPGVLRLLIEFDVADSIVISSGTILVKLVKSGSVLGLSFTCRESRKRDEALVISEVRKGSVAHRVGALGLGDALLAIDDVDVVNCSVAQVIKMLNNCADVVQLTIRKNESPSGVVSSNFLIFSVELPLHSGGQLGIFLASTDSSGIIVSHIANDSIAYRTNALKSGDEILSINNIPLETRTSFEAQRLLDSSTGSVCLKIKRQAANSTARTRRPPGQKAQNSIDSAVDSCDSRSTPNSDTANHSATTATESLPPADPIVQHPQLHQQQQLHLSNELKVTAEVHSMPTKTTQPEKSGHVEFQIETIDDAFPVPVHPPEEDEWSSKLDELEKLSVDTVDRLSGSFSHLPQVDQNYVRDRSSGTTPQQKFISDLVIFDDKETTEDNGTKEARDFRSAKETGSHGDAASSTNSTESGIEGGGRGEGGGGRGEGFANAQVHSTSQPEVTQTKNDLAQAPSGVVVDELVDCFENENGFKPTEMRERKPEVGRGGHIGSAVDQGSTDERKVKELKQLEELLESIFTPTPVELLKVVLYKTRSNDDFGFSLSDGVYEKGVYVSGVKPGGPAAEGLQPYDKILQINQIKTKDLDCHQVVPLIAQSGNCVELIVCRNALASSTTTSSSSLPRPTNHRRQLHRRGFPPNVGFPISSSSTSSSFSVGQPQLPTSRSSTWSPNLDSAELWKPRNKRRVNFLQKNTFF